MRALALLLALALAGDAHAGSAIRRLPQPIACGTTTLPTVRATIGVILGGTAAIAPAMPVGSAPGDLVLMFCETQAWAVTATGWTQAVDVAQTGTRLTVLYRILTGSDASTTNFSSDHIICRTMAITGGTFCESTPIGPTNTNTQTATASVSITGTTTSNNNSLIVQASHADVPDSTSTSQFSVAGNASLGTVTERIDNCNTSGTGGCLFVMTGTLVTAGASGTATATAASALGVKANATIAINPRR